MTDSPFFQKVQAFSEGWMTRRRHKKRVKKEISRSKPAWLDWVESFLWAVGVVLLLNQYLFQAFMIPSGSMIDTLLIKDRIFVNKLIYGPELLPGIGKLPSPIKPERNDIIIFENPTYISKGAAFDIAQRVIFMLTLSLVDIDRGADGEQLAHLLVKRAAAADGDWIRFVNGDMELRVAGENRWVRETDYNAARGFNHNISRLVPPDAYTALNAYATAVAYRDLGMTAPSEVQTLASQVAGTEHVDYYGLETARLKALRTLRPDDRRYRAASARSHLGYYVPPGYVMPLGDNRDNSRDARSFGPVRGSKILGQGFFTFWPINRIGVIR
jgi:signal peptidase I